MLSAAPRGGDCGVDHFAVRSAGLYIALGSPNVPWEPAFARVDTSQGRESIASLVSKVEAHLASNPNDGSGWEVIAPVYMRLGRFDDAVAARKKSLALNGDSATRQADLGEAMTAAADGVVTADAKAAFERAVARDPHEAKARYFLGLAAEQDGNIAQATTVWRSLLADAPAGAPWIKFVSEALARARRRADFQRAGTKRGGCGSRGRHDRRRAPRHGPRHGRASCRPAARQWRRRRRLAASCSRLCGSRRPRQGEETRPPTPSARLPIIPTTIKQIDELVKGLGLEG